MGEKLMRPIEVRFEKNINNLNLVREADTGRQWEYVTVAMLAALFVMGFLFYGWQRFQYMQYGYSLETAQKEQAKLVQKRARLRLEREQLQSPTRIASKAKEMGLVPSVPGQLVPIGGSEYRENSQPQLSANK